MAGPSLLSIVERFADARVQFLLPRTPQGGDRPNLRRDGRTDHRRGVDSVVRGTGQWVFTMNDLWYTDNGVWRSLLAMGNEQQETACRATTRTATWTTGVTALRIV